jgi:peptide/nickel transport system ATP-binding protein
MTDQEQQPEQPPIIRAEGISKSFGTITKHVAVHPTDIAFAHGSLTGVVGESGSGKSTLARMLSGLTKPTTGAVFYNDVELSGALRKREGRLLMRKTVQFVGQDTTSSFDPRHTLRDSLARPARNLFGWSRRQASDEVDELVSQLGLPAELVDRFPHQVSGGQRQRMALARGLITRPDALICDEVVSALDVSVQAVVLNHLKRICRERGAALIFVSHGLPATAFVSDAVKVMLRGEIVEDGPVSAVLHEPTHPYTRSLLDAYGGRDLVTEDNA